MLDKEKSEMAITLKCSWSICSDSGLICVVGNENGDYVNPYFRRGKGLFISKDILSDFNNTVLEIEAIQTILNKIEALGRWPKKSFFSIMPKRNEKTILDYQIPCLPCEDGFGEIGSSLWLSLLYNPKDKFVYKVKIADELML